MSFPHPTFSYVVTSLVSLQFSGQNHLTDRLTSTDRSLQTVRIICVILVVYNPRNIFPMLQI